MKMGEFSKPGEKEMYPFQKDDRMNVVLFITDQHRADCLGIEGNPVLQTPYLDWLASTGTRFTRAYSECPVCVPARRSLITGRTPASHGVLMNHDAPLNYPTLPGELSRTGYQTHLVGKLHLWPHRKLYGFNSADWSDGPAPLPGIGDYEQYLYDNGINSAKAGISHGCDQNGWISRPWHLDESLHFTNWAAQKSLDFLSKRDPTVPFFLQVGFHQPHQPCTPPAVYWNRYINKELPQPVVGDWSKKYDTPQSGSPPAAWRVFLNQNEQQQYTAGYYGCINHIDNQIGRIIETLPENTLIIFLSDHGEMLGDHQWIRKRNAFEGSTRIPCIIRFPEKKDNFNPDKKNIVDAVVGLSDIMPTILESINIEIPDTVEGKSLLPLIKGESSGVHDFIHGECSSIPTLNSGMQYMTDGNFKYIWYPGSGEEQLFDLANDPKELINLSADGGNQTILSFWQSKMVNILMNRPEGFVTNSMLQKLSGPSTDILPENFGI
jgi:arylsulfatase